MAKDQKTIGCHDLQNHQSSASPSTDNKVKSEVDSYPLFLTLGAVHE